MAEPVTGKKPRKVETSPKSTKKARVTKLTPVVRELAFERRQSVGPPICVRVTHTMLDACDRLIKADQSSALVLEAHEAIWRPILVLTENDILRAYSKGGNCRLQTIGDWMQAEGRKPSRVHSVPGSTTIADAAERFTKYASSSDADACHHLLVTQGECDGEAVDESQFVGIVSSLDLARAIAVHMVAEVKTPDHRAMTAPADPPPLSIDEPANPPDTTEQSVTIVLDDEEDNLSCTLRTLLMSNRAVESPEAVHVDDVMKPLKDVQKCTPKTTMHTAAGALLDSHQNCLVVHDGTQMLGILTPRDFLRAFSDSMFGEQLEVACWVRGLAQDLHPRFIAKTSSLLDAAQQMMDVRVHHLLATNPGVDGKDVVGVISSLDLAYSISPQGADRPKWKISAALLDQLPPIGSP